MSLAICSSNQTAVPTKTDSDSTSKKSSLNGRFYTYLGVGVGLVATAVALYYLSQSNASPGNGVIPETPIKLPSDSSSSSGIERSKASSQQNQNDTNSSEFNLDNYAYQPVDRAVEERLSRELPCVAARLQLRGSNDTGSLQISDLGVGKFSNVVFVKESSEWGKKNLEMVTRYNGEQLDESIWLKVLFGHKKPHYANLDPGVIAHPDNLLPQCVNIPGGEADRIKGYFKEVGVPDEIIESYSSPDLQTWAQGCNEQEMKSAMEEIVSKDNPLYGRGFDMSRLFQQTSTYLNQGKLDRSAPNVCLNLVGSRSDYIPPVDTGSKASPLEEKHIVPLERFWNQLRNSFNPDPTPSFPPTKASAEAPGESTWWLPGSVDELFFSLFKDGTF